MRRSIPAYLTALAAAAALTGACGSTDHWAMPDFVSHNTNLQQAQDQLQELTDGAVRSTSHDHTGADREQVADADWKICGQSELPGNSITEESSVDFAVVKNNENCG